MRRFAFFAFLLLAAAHAQTHAQAPGLAAGQHAATLAESGHCAEALPLLSRSIAHITDKDLQKRVGLDGVRCANETGEESAALDFIRLLNQHFPHDPEVLYVTVHTYSDLSSAAARELAVTAPTSIPALEMDAETNELQGKWDLAEKDYRKILELNPHYPGIHFRLARLILSRPNPPVDFQDQAKKELDAELTIDPGNAGAEYILGALAQQSSDLDGAAQHFRKAAELNPRFGEAYLGLGMTLLAQKNFTDAVTPLEAAAKLLPGNPTPHYGLATAYARTGHKADAEREFAEQQKLAAQRPVPDNPAPQQ